MKKLIIVGLLLVAGNCFTEEIDFFNVINFDMFDVITDSIAWVTQEVIVEGDEDCEHEWVYSREWRAGGMSGCAVNHGGFHCDYDDSCRKKICSKCGRHEQEREQWYQHRKDRTASHYDILVDSFTKIKE